MWKGSMEVGVEKKIAQKRSKVNGQQPTES